MHYSASRAQLQCFEGEFKGVKFCVTLAVVTQKEPAAGDQADKESGNHSKEH